MEDKMMVMGKWIATIDKRATEEQFNLISGKILRYGIFHEYEETGDAFVDSQLDWILPQIDAMQEKYDTMIEIGKNGGRPSNIDNKKIWTLAREGKTGLVIAEMLGIPKSTVYDSLGWKNRKNLDFQ